MKRILLTLLVLVLLLAPLAALASCSSEEGGAPIAFGKKYMQSETDYYVFTSDGTGYHEYYRKNEDSDYTQSGRVEFLWREASDGAVHLFKTEVKYNSDHTEGKSIPLCNGALVFGEEFFTYTQSSQFGDSARYYILEGSALDRAGEKS